jgi:sugar/nucleoside kinase (ribokinase family)
LCSALVDLVLTVPGLPEAGGDVLASSYAASVGGGLNALAASAAAGLPAAYAGGHGRGPFGDQVRAAMAARGVDVLLAPSPDEDSGFCVVLVEPGGERTFVTTVGAEGHLTPVALSGYRARADDLVYVSGYDLAYPHGSVVAEAVGTLPADTLVLFDPGPLVAELDADLLRTVAGHSTWVSLNDREAALWTGYDEADTAARSLLDSTPGLVGVVVRSGQDGCVVLARGATPVPVPVATVAVGQVVDTNGAGDVHAGTFAAGLAAGADPIAAASRANAAAARSVTLAGPGLSSAW